MQADYSVINAAERFSRLGFSADQDWQTYPDSTYTCPHCREQMSFAMRDFETHCRSQFSNLSANDAQSIAAVSPPQDDKYNSFLDFYCPGCWMPVRVLYLFWVGGRFTHGYDLAYVIERRV
jgi:hypothetical protein